MPRHPRTHARALDRTRVAGVAFGILTFVGAAAIHVATFVPGAYLPMERLWIFHVLAMISFAAFIGRRSFPMYAPGTHIGLERARESLEFRREFRRKVPRIVRLLFGALMIYCSFNFLATFVFNEGIPRRMGNGYEASFQGRKPAQVIGETEFRRLQTRTTRGFSGHWMLFALAGALGLAFLVPRADSAEAATG